MDSRNALIGCYDVPYVSVKKPIDFFASEKNRSAFSSGSHVAHNAQKIPRIFTNQSFDQANTSRSTAIAMFNLFNSNGKNPVSPPSSSSPAASADADRVRKETEEALMEFYNYISKDIGCVTNDLAPIFENYEAERKKWVRMRMRTI